MKNQEKIFFNTEGDNWFVRNNKKIGAVKISQDLPLFLMEKYSLQPKKILEIGCSNGWRLNEINKRYHSRCFGIEPSLRAISDGRKKYKKILFKRGLVHNLPLNDKNKFDLIIVNFVLHWVSRELLFKAIAEIDRVLVKGGHLIIGDFLPDYPVSNFYHHLPDKVVYTYKLDYAHLFLDSAFYRIVAQLTFDHKSELLLTDTSSLDRCVCSLLKKL
ncbi:class I SAM-dependent methyltransferase [Patescibacteria group bacterium]|nr:class I SAM-dependent methyltransferase [Patescibacteria group bacterium]